LKAPLSYRRITSGYTGARMHPVTRKVSAHYQIDYAAPTGTPVVASARGSVSSAGWEGGWGNMIRLRHDGGYTTHYGHLSAIAKGIRSGASVAQNQVIGYVGSTGWSTGPHLDYGMKLNGSPVNPLALNLPKGNPLNGETMKIFEEEKNKYAKLLE
jgi:murein DD-endopeptidase MepM/ murein hydrolase activator NlpD